MHCVSSSSEELMLMIIQTRDVQGEGAQDSLRTSRSLLPAEWQLSWLSGAKQTPVVSCHELIAAAGAFLSLAVQGVDHHGVFLQDHCVNTNWVGATRWLDEICAYLTRSQRHRLR